MMERKFTDDEIVKALECCCNNEDCIGCPCLDHGCYYEVQYSLDLINRQKAEIERLKSPSEMQIEVSEKIEKSIKTEAIKEFVERLKESCFGNPYLDDDVLNELTDNLVKEMTNKLEENNNER